MTLSVTNSKLFFGVGRSLIQENVPMFSTVIMELEDKEVNLNDGRFRNFSETISTLHTVNIEDDTIKQKFSPSVIAAQILNQKEPLYSFECKINWISDNIENKWFVRIPNFINDNSLIMNCLFDFEKEIDALHFALRWK